MVNLKKKYLKYKQKYLMDKLKGGSVVSSIFNGLFTTKIQEQYKNVDLLQKISFINYHLESIEHLKNFLLKKFDRNSMNFEKFLVKISSVPKIWYHERLLPDNELMETTKMTDTINLIDDTEKLMQFLLIAIIENLKAIKGPPDSSGGAVDQLHYNNLQLTTSVIYKIYTDFEKSISPNVLENLGAILISVMVVAAPEGTKEATQEPTSPSPSLSDPISTFFKILDEFNKVIQTSIPLKIKYEHILQQMFSIYKVFIAFTEKESQPENILSRYKLLNTELTDLFIFYIYLDDSIFIELFKPKLNSIFNLNYSNESTLEADVKSLDDFLKKINDLDKGDSDKNISVNGVRFSKADLENGMIVKYGEGEGDCGKSFYVKELPTNSSSKAI